MKKVLIIIMFLILVGCTNAETNNSSEDTTAVQEESIEFTRSMEVGVSDSITIKIDPKIELTYLIIHLLSEETGYNVYQNENSYTSKYVDKFSEHKDHEVFAILKNMISQGFTYDAIPGVLHYYNDDLELIENITMDENLLERAGGKEQIETFIDALADFRRVSNYDEFFAEKEDYLELLINRAKKHVISANVESIIADYYGEHLGDIVITITPESALNFGNRIFIGEQQVLMPTISVSLDEESYISLLLHEISHSYVNPQTSLKLDEVNNLEVLFDAIEESMKAQAYGSWETCLNEHIVRANVILMLEDLYGELAREKRIAYEERLDFIYLDNILGSMDDYAKSRDEYPKFHMYYDVILENLKNEL